MPRGIGRCHSFRLSSDCGCHHHGVCHPQQRLPVLISPRFRGCLFAASFGLSASAVAQSQVAKDDGPATIEECTRYVDETPTRMSKGSKTADYAAIKAESVRLSRECA